MITIAEGIKEVNSINNIVCNQLTYIPQNNWKELSEIDKINIIASDKEREIYQTIGLIKLPEEFIVNQNLNKIQEIKNGNSDKNLNNDFPAIVKALANFCKNYQIIEEEAN